VSAASYPFRPLDVPDSLIVVLMATLQQLGRKVSTDWSASSKLSSSESGFNGTKYLGNRAQMISGACHCRGRPHYTGKLATDIERRALAARSHRTG
jgi:hypothetical protein